MRPQSSSDAMAPLVWLITGTSSGFGLCLAKAVLEAGHRVIATSRSPFKSTGFIEELENSGNDKWMQLDVASDELEHQVEACVKVFGQVDVLVNNAASVFLNYGSGGALEDISLAEIHRQMEVNFFGPVRTTKALIPHMRERGSGTIINVTSTVGFSGMPALSMYAASKHALEGLSESLAGELAPFGIRVLIVEPGDMRTNFVTQKNSTLAPLSLPYKGTVVEYVTNAVLGMHGKQLLDPERSARRIVEAVAGEGLDWPDDRASYLRLVLGRECIGSMEAKVKMLQDNLAAMRMVSSSVDFDA
ncbi:hypothetical protein LTS10_001779 [Elasticomyces elasticus]|nr:hypothetical protein LTS10_001779 [Elasticomyces elasticus]